MWTEVKEKPVVTRGGNSRVAAGKTEHVDLRLAVPSVSAVSCGSRFARHGPVRPCEVRTVSPPRLSVRRKLPGVTAP